MTEHTPPPPDEKDWTWVVERTCTECGYDAAAVASGDIADRVLTLTAPWLERLASADVGVRPAATTWSPLEYGCHVRDVCRVFTERTTLMLTEDSPTFANWDQDIAAVDGAYHQQDPAAVGRELAAAARAWAELHRSVPEDAWDRPGLRGNGAAFTVTTLGRYGLHDLAHHLVDVGVPRSW